MRPSSRRAVAALVVMCGAVSCGGADSAAERRAQLRRSTPAAPTASASAPAVATPPTVDVESCSDTGEGMGEWLDAFRAFAVAQGVSEDAASSALSLAWYDAEVIELDRTQRSFKVSYDEFLASHVTSDRVARGRSKQKSLASQLAKLEEQYGVQREVLVAIWGLETDYGATLGTRSSVRSIATLAFDCRRPALFRGELLSVLRIVERGDMRADEMVGAWAGEIGQTQFLPSSYEKYGVDGDGDGRKDLIGSAVDALASTANFLAQNGWKKGEGYAVGAPNFAIVAAWNASTYWQKTIVSFAADLKRGR